MSKIHPIFIQQGELLAKRDLDGLMDLYHPDAVFVRFQRVASGKKEIREVLEKYIALQLEFVALEEYVDTGETIMMRSTMKVEGETETSCATLVLRDGKIWRQAAAREGGARDWGF